MLSVALLAYKDGPPPNMTGGFGGETCRMCHTGSDVNAAGGSLRVNGLPERYRAGAVYLVTVTLTKEALSVGGFQMTARSADGGSAGSWRAVDDRAKAVGAWIQHTLRGSRAMVDGENRWQVEWTAPDAAAGEVQIHVAGNASNDDASALGDSIYTAEIRIAAER